jgi:hypothetical protein
VRRAECGRRSLCPASRSSAGERSEREPEGTGGSEDGDRGGRGRRRRDRRSLFPRRFTTVLVEVYSRGWGREPRPPSRSRRDRRGGRCRDKHDGLVVYVNAKSRFTAKRRVHPAGRAFTVAPRRGKFTRFIPDSWGIPGPSIFGFRFGAGWTPWTRFRRYYANRFLLPFCSFRMTKHAADVDVYG